MKKARLLFVCLFSVSLFYGCENNNDQLQCEKIEFMDLRQTVYQTPLTIFDDTVSLETTVRYDDQIILKAAWKQGIYSGPIIKTRLLWACSKSNQYFLIVGFDDLFYEQLIAVKTDATVSSYEIGIIKLLQSELRDNETKIWLKYNNSWTRTGVISDSETQIILN